MTYIYSSGLLILSGWFVHTVNSNGEMTLDKRITEVVLIVFKLTAVTEKYVPCCLCRQRCFSYTNKHL